MQDLPLTRSLLSANRYIVSGLSMYEDFAMINGRIKYTVKLILSKISSKINLYIGYCCTRALKTHLAGSHTEVVLVNVAGKPHNKMVGFFLGVWAYKAQPASLIFEGIGGRIL